MAMGSGFCHYQLQVVVKETGAVEEGNTGVGHIVTKRQNHCQNQTPTMSKQPHCLWVSLERQKLGD